QERGGLVPQGISAELIAEKWDISREDNDRFSLESHLRAARATDEGRFEQEIIPVRVAGAEGTALFSRDEGIRPDSSLEKLASLKPAFKPDGVVTAGNSSQISDGAADMTKVNVNGGAIALGHPLGCSGARLAATLLHELERTDGRWGLQVMCEGGGMANAMIIERLG